MADDSLLGGASDSSPVPSIEQNTAPDASQLANLSGSTSGPNISGLTIPSSPAKDDSSSTHINTLFLPQSSTAPKSSQADPNVPNLKAARKQAKREAKEREKARKKAEADRIQEEAVKVLGDQLKLGRLAICVGSGVTLYSAPSQSQRLSWWGLMNNALDYYEDQASTLAEQPRNQADLLSARAGLQKANPTEADREDVANRIQKLLSNRIDLETTWMRAQFKNLYKDYVDQLDILDALKTLQQNGALLFTTNYDDLLESHCDLDPIDAADPNGLISWRRGSHQAVFHPHGYWRNANNIVLSAEHYWRVKNDQIVQETLQHILTTRTVLFVGCGGGLSDPNFGPLIQWAGEKNVGTGASHYILLQAPEKNPVTHLPLVHLRSENFDAFPRFLKDLLPKDQRREGTLTELPDDRERKRIDEWLVPLDQTRFLNDIINLQGPNRFDRQLTQSQDVWSVNSPSRVLVTGEEGWGKTMFCTSVIQNTLRDCQLGTLKRSRDSLAYFFCATYQPHFESPSVQMNDFNTFLRTVISQLTPPDTVFDPLRNLYTACTRYHPARLPTDAELEDILIQILWILDKPAAPKKGEPLEPGETYLVIDELNSLTPTMRDQYSRFIKTLANQRLQHFHLLVAADSPVSVGVPRSPRPRKLTPPKGKKGKGKGGMGKSKAVFTAPQAPGLNAANWHTITLDWSTTSTAMLEWMRDCFANNPSLAIFGNLRSEVVSKIYQLQQNFRWVYWKLDRLGGLGATSGGSDDETLRAAVDGILEDSDKDEDSDDSDDDDAPSDPGYFDSDDDDDYITPGGKRSKKQQGGKKKKVKIYDGH
ncbi:SIR2-like domain-containing protein [Xylaria longipes]|nr:SIR2-like domain-containing protein [Xylaria longipes]